MAAAPLGLEYLEITVSTSLPSTLFSHKMFISLSGKNIGACSRLKNIFTGKNEKKLNVFCDFVASLPHVFFPCVMATDKETGVRIFGIEALKPDIRSKCVISYPVRPAVKADKVFQLKNPKCLFAEEICAGHM